MYGPNIQSLYSGRMLSCLYCTDISYLHLFTQFHSVYSLDFCGDVWMHFCIFIYSFSDNRYAWISFEHLNECMNVWRWSVEEVFQTLVKCFVQEYLYLYYFIYGSLRFIKILQTTRKNQMSLYRSKIIHSFKHQRKKQLKKNMKKKSVCGMNSAILMWKWIKIYSSLKAQG